MQIKEIDKLFTSFSIALLLSTTVVIAQEEGLPEPGAQMGETVPFTRAGAPQAKPFDRSDELPDSRPFESVTQPKSLDFSRPPDQSESLEPTGSGQPPANYYQQPVEQSDSPPPYMESLVPPGTFKGELSRNEARDYMLYLINRDRQSYGLRPVQSDPTATRGGQVHTDDMVTNDFPGHWGIDGKKPDQRYTEAGGGDKDAENAFYSSSFKDGSQWTPDAQPRFDRAEMEAMESGYFNEKPPNDGHRKNILNPDHTHVGIALSKATPSAGPPRTANTQEFVDRYGVYAPLPRSMPPRSAFNLAGRLYPGVRLQSVQVRLEGLPQPMVPEQLKKMGGYGGATNVIQTYFPQMQSGKQPIMVRDTGNGQEFTVRPEVKGKGLYYIYIWAFLSGQSKPIVVSLRTIDVE